MVTVLVILFVVLVPYLTVGARYSRNRYATIATNPVEPMENHLPKCKAHDWTSEKYRHEYCNCEYYKSQQPDYVPASIFKPMVLWPGYKLEEYLKGGEASVPNYRHIQKLEQQLGINYEDNVSGRHPRQLSDNKTSH
jgi:hypothetical protein